MSYTPSIPEILITIRPGAEWTFLGGSDIVWEEVLDDQETPTGEFIAKNLVWLDENHTHPSKDEIETARANLTALWISTEYQRQRQPEYPPLTDLADALYWQSQGDESKMTAYLAAVEAVKQKYPKGV